MNTFITKKAAWYILCFLFFSAAALFLAAGCGSDGSRKKVGGGVDTSAPEEQALPNQPQGDPDNVQNPDDNTPTPEDDTPTPVDKPLELAAWKKQIIDVTGGKLAVAFDTDGLPAVVYLEFGSAGLIRYAKRQDDLTWKVELINQFTYAVDPNQKLDLVITPKGVAHIATKAKINQQSDNPVDIYKDGDTWVKRTISTLTSTFGVNTWNKAGIDQTGNPSFVFGIDSTVYSNRLSAGVWNTDTVASSLRSGIRPNAFEYIETPDINPVAVMGLNSQPSLTFAERKGGIWELSLLGAEGIQPSMISDLANNLYVAYCEVPTSALTLEKRASSETFFMKDDTIPQRKCNEVSIASDHAGNMHILYRNTDETIYYLFYNGEEWVETALSEMGNGQYQQLAINDTTGDVTIVYYDPDARMMTALSSKLTPAGAG